MYLPITPKDYKIKKLLRREGIDGAVTTSPENCYYLTALAGNQNSVSRQPGMNFGLVCADDGVPAVALTMDFEADAFAQRNIPGVKIRSYDTWVGLRRAEDLRADYKAPAQAPMTGSLDVVLEVLEDMGVAEKRIGLELDTLPYSYYAQIREKLPKAEFVNVSPLFIEARSVKEADEIERFRDMCAVADNAFCKVSQAAAPGVSERELSQIFREEVIKSGKYAPSPWNMFSCGAAAATLSSPGDRVLGKNDLFKFDAGVYGEFDFYTTDTSRSWIFGNIDPVFHKLKDRLYEAQRKMLEAAKPGLPIGDLYRTGYEWVKAAFPSYVRGHMGHSISLGPQTAEAPVIAAAETRPLEAGMVLAIEAPCYVQGKYGFNIEDMVLITERGAEVLTPRTPHYL